MEKPQAAPTDSQRLRALVNAPVLFDQDVEELRRLAQRFGVAVKVQRVDLASDGRVSEYKIEG